MTSELNSPSHARTLLQGATVSIVRTENVQQRAPHLIGRIGTVVEVPVHPNTWFRVEFDGGDRHTFRPSALRLVSDTFPAPTFPPEHHAAEPSSSSSPPQGGPEGRGRSRRGKKDMESLDADEAGDRASHSTGTAAQRKAGDDTLLSTVDADVWIGKMVRIKGGRFIGHTGRVLRSGNGWVQLQTAMGEVAKRAYELHLLPPEEQDTEPTGPGDEKGRKRKGPEGGAMGTTSMSKSKRAKLEASPAGGPVGHGIAVPSLPLASDGGPAASGKAKAGSGARGRRINQRHQGSAAAARIAESRAALDRYQEHIRKHLERQMEKAKERPNLAWWLKEFKADAAAESLEGEATPIVDIGPPCCDLCDVDLPYVASTCWNAACAASPLHNRAIPAAHTTLGAKSAPCPAVKGSTNDDMAQIDIFHLTATSKWLNAARKNVYATVAKALPRSPRGKKARAKGKQKASVVADDYRDPLLYRWRCTQAPSALAAPAVPSAPSAPQVSELSGAAKLSPHPKAASSVAAPPSVVAPTRDLASHAMPPPPPKVTLPLQGVFAGGMRGNGM